MPNMNAIIKTFSDATFNCFKGEPGTRKSTCALSYPTPQYWFSCEGKMDSLLIPMRNWGINPDQITFDEYNDFDKVRAKLEKFQLNCTWATRSTTRCRM